MLWHWNAIVCCSSCSDTQTFPKPRAYPSAVELAVDVDRRNPKASTTQTALVPNGAAANGRFQRMHQWIMGRYGLALGQRLTHNNTIKSHPSTYLSLQLCPTYLWKNVFILLIDCIVIYKIIIFIYGFLVTFKQIVFLIMNTLMVFETRLAFIPNCLLLNLVLVKDAREVSSMRLCRL